MAKNKQHYIPRTYLKAFSIPNEKSFIYGLDLENPYERKIKKKGLNSRGFTSFRFYSDDRFEDPDSLENSFEKIENFYPNILAEIKNEQNLSEDIRQEILLWLFISIKRSPVERDTTYRLFAFTKKVISDALSIKQNKDLKALIKQEHIDSFYSEEILQEFINQLISSQWKILKSPTQIPFITNDNPGFSINSKTFIPSLSFRYERDQINHFILCPEYCLEISWFYPESPINQNALNMEIEFHEISSIHVCLINECVAKSANRWILSHSKEEIEKYIKI